MSPERAERGPASPERSRRGAGGVDEHLVSLVSPASFPAEQYRVLRHLVEQMHKEHAVSVLAVTSAVPGDGKTTTAINLAGALGQGPNHRVLLVEADLRRPSMTLADRLGLGDTSGPGLADLILDPAYALAEVIREHPRFALSVLPAGHCPAAYYEVLKSPRFGGLLEEARRQYDYVILDTPPAIVVPDCRVISRWIDGFIIVVAAHKTPLRLVEEVVNVVGSTKTLGLVFNGDDGPLSRYAAYGYGHPGGWDSGGRAYRWRRARGVGASV